MPQSPHYLAPELGSTTDTVAPAKSPRVLPHDLLMQASHRLGIISLIGAVLWLTSTIIYDLLYYSRNPGVRFPSPTDWISLSAMVCSLGLFLFSRRYTRNPALLLNLGLVYIVITCADISLISFLDPVWVGLPAIPLVTWNGAIVLLCAAIVPATPGRMAATAAIAVSMHPLVFLYGHYSGQWTIPLSAIAIRFFPDVLLGATAVMISHVLTGLGRQVSKAREMGSYRMVSLLGKGGMGEVWRASHRMLARDAAIKLIHPYMLQRDAVRAEAMRLRFEQEAKATASLRSPHTIELYDFGVTADGVFYYAMEFLDGIDLQTLVRRFGPQPPARVIVILRQVCRSLAEAHRRGMIHRDIKPTNIFLCRMGDELDFVKVLDFGLVKLLDHDIQLTRDDSTLGTPAYMAPELALGSESIDGRADLYSLGCVAYWLLTGNLVFEEKGPTATMMAHLNKPPLPPSQRIELPIPPQFENVILACLSKQPEERPASAEALHQALEECDVRPSWSRQAASAWWQTHLPGDVPASVRDDSGSTASAAALR